MTQPNQPHTSQEQRPREFWLDLATMHGDPCDFISEGKPCEIVSSTNIHVIEYSAYQSLQQKVADLEAEKKRSELFVPELNEQSYTQALRMCHDLQSKLKILEAENKKYRKALELNKKIQDNIFKKGDL